MESPWFRDVEMTFWTGLTLALAFNVAASTSRTVYVGIKIPIGRIQES